MTKKISKSDTIPTLTITDNDGDVVELEYYPSEDGFLLSISEKLDRHEREMACVNLTVDDLERMLTFARMYQRVPLHVVEEPADA